MAYFISDRQALASDRERSAYTPFVPEIRGCKRTEEMIDKGHPLYTALCSISTLESTSNEMVVYPVVPDGCISMFFYTRDKLNYAKLCGVTDSIRKFIVYPGDQILIFRFMPGHCESFVKCDGCELTNKAVDIQEVIRNGQSLTEIAKREISIEWKALLMSRVLRMETNERDTDYLIRFCTEAILKNNGNIQVAELAKKSGFSQRYLGKIFERYIGIPPKTYAEIIRLQRSLRMIFDPENKSSLLEIAMDNGYFDHAHMNRAYNRYLNCSSGALRRSGFSIIDYNKVESLI